MNCRVLQYASLRGEIDVKHASKWKSRTCIILSIESIRNNGETNFNILVYAGPFLDHNTFSFEFTSEH